MPEGDVTVTATFLSEWGGLQNLLNAGGTVTLDKDYTAAAEDTCLTVPSGVTVTLDLNGHTIDRNLTEATANSNGNVITVSGNLTVTDSDSTSTHSPAIRDVKKALAELRKIGALDE